MRKPDKTLLYWIDRDRSVTYAEGSELSAKVAGALATLGIQKGDRVGIFAHNGLDYKLAMLGAWKLGAISCHIDLRQAENIAYFANLSMPKVLIYTHDFFNLIDRYRSQMPTIKHYLCMDGAQEGAQDWNVLVAAAPPAPDIELSSNDLAYLSFSSASSDSPRELLFSHGHMAQAAHHFADRLGMSNSDVTLGLTSPAKMLDLIANLLPGIQRGATIGMMSKWDAARAWDEMEKRKVTICTGNPQILVDLVRECRKRFQKPAALRTIISENVPLDLTEAFSREFDIVFIEARDVGKINSEAHLS